eukprot:TRINITY_DN50066_c0_g1_i1.p1 TRINITY_DN50066_c0_g1~~TRINITY_DN50066_c0_g1_i1.p1  ORF type:complete len:604 (+),score=199.66 TRINITY_DN50066_c0_g1_i1:83-1894(+)
MPDDAKPRPAAVLGRYLRPEGPALIFSASALLASSAANAATPSLLRSVIDASSPQSARAALTRALAVFAVGALGSAVRTATLDAAQQRVELRLRAALLKSLMRKEKSFFDGTDRGSELVSVVQEDAATVARAATGGAANLVRMISSVIGGLLSAAAVSGRLTALSLSVVPAVVFCALRLHKRLRAARDRMRAVADRQTDFLHERFGGMSVVRLFGGEDAACDEYARLQGEAAELARAVARLDGAFYGVLDLSIKATLLAVIALGSGLVRAGQLTAGQLTSFALHSGMLGMGLAGLARAAGELSLSRAAAARVSELLAPPPRLGGSPRLVPADCTGEVRLNNVSFAYPGRPQHKVLRGVDLRVAPGRVTALVGRSGAGKTTVARLIGKLYDPAEGSVSLDGVDLRDCDSTWLRKQVGVVEQDAALFRGTVRGNIALAREDASQEQIELAAQQASADFIDTLPQKYDTEVGPRGERLSGGQRQRIAVARALLRDPKALVLDEATSALDAESEECIRAALRRAAAAGRSVLVIAHRESTVRIADFVYVMDGGRVVEQGTYADLSAQEGGRFKTLMTELRREAGESSDGSVGGELPQPEDSGRRTHG